ncbi:hypothetical protein QVD17_22676 [Tagetes erecta]|uniref:Uncharacterized protein n=1 Tax=Tagetes erecta TaxID=13708 RepID=A0AAD8KGT1_TARER|nr:hypothetical protein QVD17_22676 [Tagetes erecta]
MKEKCGKSLEAARGKRNMRTFWNRHEDCKIGEQSGYQSSSLYNHPTFIQSHQFKKQATHSFINRQFYQKFSSIFKFLFILCSER